MANGVTQTDEGLELGTTETPYATIYGAGEGEVQAPVNVRRAGAKIPSVDTAGPLLPPEEGPPAAEAPYAGPMARPEEETGPLLGPNSVTQQMLDDTDRRFQEQADRDRAELVRLREEQARRMGAAGDVLRQGYEAYGAAGKEAMDLAEQQRLRRPAPPKPPVEPAVPQQRIRLFGEGPENETGMQALQRITMSLGLMAQMGMGMKSGYTRGAMASFSGAMKGWAEGNKIAGDQQWREYLATVQKLDREWARDRQAFDDILRTDAVDMDRAKLKMAIKQTEMGYGKEMVALTLRDFDQRFKMFDVERDILQNQMKASLEVMKLRAMNDLKQQAQLDMQEFRRETIVERRLTREREEERNRQQALYEQGRLGESAADRASRERIATADRLSREKLAAEKPAAGGQKMQEMRVAATNAKSASDKIDAIMADPTKAAEVSKWLGGTLEGKGQKAIDFASSYTLGGAVKPPPQSVVDVSQYVAELRNELLNLKSGKQVTGIEETRLNNSLVTMDLRPEVFKRRIQNMKPFIDEMLTWKDKAPSGAAGGGTPAGPAAPAGASSGGVTTVIVKNAKGEIGHFNLQPGQKVPSGYEVVR